MNPGDWRYQPGPGQVPWRAPPARRPEAPQAATRTTSQATTLSSSALVFRHVKIAPHEIPRVLVEMDAVVRRRKRMLGLGFVLAVATSLALLVFPPVGIITFVIALIYFHGRRARHRRLVAKVDFLRALLSQLVDELHPRAPVRFDFDLSAYDEDGKLFRSASSSAGNKKTYYSDKWLRLRVCLADKTQVEVVRQQGIKVKKGNVQFEKRRLFVTVTPNACRYRPMDAPLAQRLRRQVSQEIQRGFDNRPELFHLQVTPTSADIGLKIVQEDVDILPSDVIVVLRGTMNHLRERYMAQAGAVSPSPTTQRIGRG